MESRLFASRRKGVDNTKLSSDQPIFLVLRLFASLFDAWRNRQNGSGIIRHIRPAFPMAIGREQHLHAKNVRI